MMPYIIKYELNHFNMELVILFLNYLQVDIISRDYYFLYILV